MTPTQLHLLLADNDYDDCNFFKEALEELQLPVNLTIVNDGAKLMQLLSSHHGALPHALFLDVNMPCKNGFDCLKEIKQHKILKHIPVIILTTSLNEQMINKLYEEGALYYICKPAEFSNLKKVLLKAINLIPYALKEYFVLTPD